MAKILFSFHCMNTCRSINLLCSSENIILLIQILIIKIIATQRRSNIHLTVINHTARTKTFHPIKVNGFFFN